MERDMFNKILNTKLYLGPMTKNIVDGVIVFAEKHNTPLCLIASRRQIDQNGGYVNNWTTSEFATYVKKRSDNVLVCRDHGGIGQGRLYDDGIFSLLEDAVHMDLIHIDPWKKLNVDDAVDYTTKMIILCSKANNNCVFEVGTEESIFTMTPDQLEYLLLSIQKRIPNLFHKIKYAVIQSGTSLKDGSNTGQYNETRLIDMINVCLKFNVLSKEHNGDYLTPRQIKNKFNIGLNSINIAPEVAHIETSIILNSITSIKFDKWFNLCVADGQWSKWFSKGFDPNENKEKVIELCGHYVLSNQEFIDIFDLDLISNKVYGKLEKFILERTCVNG